MPGEWLHIGTSRLLTVCLGLASMCVACDGGVEPDTDAGDVRDDAGPARFSPDSCDAVTHLEGALGTVSLSLDTSATTTRPRDLGPWCGNARSETWSPQEVVEYVVPGTGPMLVTFSTVNDGTAPELDTLLQIRSGDCRPPPPIVFQIFGRTGALPFPIACVDDAARGEIRSAIRYPALGGDVLYAFVTGYPEGTFADRGPVQLDVTAEPAAPPVLESVEATRSHYLALRMNGREPGPEASGFIARFENAAGEIVDIHEPDSGWGRLDLLVEVFYEPLERTPSGFTAVYGGWPGPGRLDELGVDTVRVRVFDATGSLSNEVIAEIQNVPVGGYGDACDPLSAPCSLDLVCDAGSCGANPATVAFCAAASPIDLPPAAPEATRRARISGALSDTTDVIIAPSCAAVWGRTAAHLVDVPSDGTYDLLARTDLPGTGALDTVLHVRTTCDNPHTELACADDAAADVLQSVIELRNAPAGPLYVMVDRFGRVGALEPDPYELEVALRPVLASGATCDPTGLENRCASGACSATSSLCP